MTSGVARDQLRAFIERVERLEEEIKALNDDKSDIYKEARGQGFDVKTMRKVIALRKMEPDAREEQDALLDTYLIALGMLPDFDEAGRAPARTREIIEESRPQTSSETSSAGDPSPTSGERDLVEAGTGQNSAVLPQEPCKASSSNEPAAAVETAGDYLRKPAATVSGQIVREGDAPRETGRHDGGVASCLDAEFTSGGDEVGAVKGDNARLPDTDGVEPSPLGHRWSKLRPHCLNPDLCSGYGDKHCTTCRQAMQNAEVAA